MDHQNNEQKTSGEEVKRSPYEDLSKEELIKRCKKLLSIAHEAKQVKTEFQAENEKLKQKLENLETQKLADKNSLITLQELVESLTEQKLKFATDIDVLRNTKTHLSEEKGALERKIEEQDITIASLKARTQELECLDSENTSYKRQTVRLQEENEELISQLDHLEKEIQELNRIGLIQREQLLLLEQNSSKENVDDVEKYKEESQELLSENNRLREELQEKTKKNIEDGNTLEEYVQKLTETQKLYETEKESKDKLNTKIRSYREKIIRCSSCITQLKNSRFVLLKTVKEYSQSIPSWQNDIAGISKMLNEQYLTLIAENKKLKEQLSELQVNSEIACLQRDAHKKNIELLEFQILMKSEENETLFNESNQECSNCDKLKVENRLLTAQIEQLETNAEKDSKNQILLDQITSLETEKLSLLKEKQFGKDLIQTEQSKLKESLESISRFKSELKFLQQEIEALQHEKTRLEALLEQNNNASEKNCSDLETQLQTLQADYAAIEKENRTLLDLNELLKDEVSTLKISLEQPNDVTQVNESLQADILKLEKKVACYKSENVSLNAELKECHHRLEDFDGAKFEVEDVQCQLVAAKMENTELLNEMKEITQALKERGETISKQTKALSDSEKVIESLEQEISSLKSAQKDLQAKLVAMAIEMEQNQAFVDNLKTENEQFKDEWEKAKIANEELVKLNAEKEESMILLREEIDRAKQQNNSFCDSRADEMSNSTISRAEEISRMKEMDDSFEERYNRLKTLAVKLKKRVTELSLQLENSEKEKTRLETEMLNETTNKVIPASAKNIQQECDRLADKLEENEKEVKAISKEKQKMAEELESVNKQVGQLKKQLDLSSQEKQALQISMTEFQQQVKNLKKDLDETRSKDLEITKLKSELSAQELLVSAELEQHRNTKDQLDKAKKDVKKRSVLSLEMADYERSMKDLTTKMEDNKKKMVQMESTIDTQQATINTLKTQIKLLEEQIKSEESQCRTLKDELQECLLQLKDKETLVNSKNEFITKLERDLEEFKSTNEELSLQMASQLGEKETTIVSLSQEKMELSIRSKRTESRCNELEESIRLNRIELDDLKTEFASYKVRAQSVLRQNQVVDHSQEERLKEETAALQAEVEGLKKQLQQASLQLTSSSSALSEERRRAVEAAENASRATERAARLHADTTSAAEQLQADNKQLQLQLSMLTQCYKKQISDLEERLRSETDELKRQVEAWREGQKSGPSQVKDDGSDGDAEISVALMPREEGEGSEWAPSPPHAPSSRRSPLSLEKLLQEGVSEELPGDMSGIGLSLEQELAELRRKLETQVQRVKHGTLLLEETEREAARLRQEGALLKTELRRAQASLERTQHAHNAEYMKNVMLKFVTLPPGDERARLVPVLQKILTLTQDETHQVQAAAKGGDPNSSKGWGSYLPWPGGR